MKYHKVISAALAMALTTSPVLAQAASADVSRSTAPVAQQSGFGEDNTLLFILGGVAVAVGLFFLIDDGDDDDEPVSPG